MSKFYILLFVLAAILLLPILNYDYLQFLSEQSLFVHGHSFMAEKMAVPGGWIEWAGCYLTQFFYEPWVGSIFLICIWVAIYLLSRKLFSQLCATLLVCVLLVSVIDLHYWIYYLKSGGYCFSQSLALLAVLVSLWGYKKVQGVQGSSRGVQAEFKGSSRGVQGTIVWGALYIIVWTIAGYQFLGWWALLATLLMGLSKTILNSHLPSLNSQLSALCSPLSALLSLILVPWISYYHYSQFRIEDAWWIGFPLFQQGDYTDWLRSMPFFIIILALVCSAIRHSYLKLHFNSLSTPHQLPFSLSTPLQLLFIALPFLLTPRDKNFRSEIQMYQAISNCHWEEALEVYSQNNSAPTQEMVMLKNVALQSLGRLGDELFYTGSIGQMPASGGLTVHMSRTAGPLLYLMNALPNYAIRWAIENSVERGTTVDQLKILAQAAIWTGEPLLAEKYLSILSATTFHREWARRAMQMVHDARLFAECEEFQAVSPLMAEGDELDFDNGLCEEYIINHYACLIAQTPAQHEAAVCYAMMLKDDELIKYQIEGYYHGCNTEQVPQHILEAVDIYNQQHSPHYQRFIHDYQTALRGGGTLGDVGRLLKKKYGHTYWWYYYFVNEFKTY